MAYWLIDNTKCLINEKLYTTYRQNYKNGLRSNNSALFWVLSRKVKMYEYFCCSNSNLMVTTFLIRKEKHPLIPKKIFFGQKFVCFIKQRGIKWKRFYWSYIWRIYFRIEINKSSIIYRVMVTIHVIYIIR